MKYYITNDGKDLISCIHDRYREPNTVEISKEVFDSKLREIVNGVQEDLEPTYERRY